MSPRSAPGAVVTQRATRASNAFLIIRAPMAVLALRQQEATNVNARQGSTDTLVRIAAVTSAIALQVILAVAQSRILHVLRAVATPSW